MKNKLFYTTGILMSALSVALCSCHEEEDYTGDDSAVLDNTPLVLTGKYYSFDALDEGNQWNNGKNLGVFMLSENGEFVNSYDNVLYKSITTPSGYFAPPQDGGEVIYPPKDGSKTNLIAYFPYQQDLENHSIPIDLSNQKSNGSPFNLLYSNINGVSKDNNKVSMELRPVLSQIVFKIVPGNGVTKEYLELSTIQVKGMYSKAQFNLLTGTFNDLDAKQDINMKMDNIDVTCDTAQVIPTTDVNDCQIYVSLPKMKREYTYNMSDDLTDLKQGKRYVTTMTVSLESIDVKTTEESIGAWGDGNITNGQLEENWITNSIDELPVEDWTITTVDNPNNYKAGDWFMVVKGAVTGSAKVEYAQDLGHNAVHATVFNNNTWHNTFVGYRLPVPNRAVYTLSFKAKGTKGKHIRCFIFPGGNQKSVAIVHPTVANSYLCTFDVLLTDTYEECSIDFDCSKMVGFNIWSSDAITGYQDAEDADLKKLLLEFNPLNSGANQTAEFYISDVKLSLKK